MNALTFFLHFCTFDGIVRKELKNWKRSANNQYQILHFNLNLMPKIPILKDSTTAVALCWALKQHFCVRSSITTPTLFMPSNKGGAKLWFTKYVLLPINTYNMHCWLCLLLLLVAKWIELGVVLYLRWQNFALVDLPLLDIVKGIPFDAVIWENRYADILCTFYLPRLVNVLEERPQPK